MGKTMYEELISAIAGCTADIKYAAGGGRLGLDTQVRAYDLLDRLLEMKDMLVPEPALKEAAEEYCRLYAKEAENVSAAFDPDRTKKEAEDRLTPFKDRLNEARFQAAAAASLHEFAKEVFDIWQTQGIFARRRALRELRERAGFRLESHRIGNYVAKTFDLMNEAQVRFAGAQQALFAADVKYKVCPGTYGEIYKILCTMCD